MSNVWGHIRLASVALVRPYPKYFSLVRIKLNISLKEIILKWFQPIVPYLLGIFVLLLLRAFNANYLLKNVVVSKRFIWVIIIYLDSILKCVSTYLVSNYVRVCIFSSISTNTTLEPVAFLFTVFYVSFSRCLFCFNMRITKILK